MNRSIRSLRNAAAGLSIGVFALALAGCGNKQEAAAANKPKDEALSVGTESVYRVEPARLSTGPLISGSLEAEKEATVAAEIPGAVLATSAEEGQPVAPGTLLARIDDSAIRESVLSAQSAVRSTAQQVAVAKRNAERAEALLKGGAIAERDAEVARWNVTSAQAALADARSRLSYAREQLAKTAVHAPFRGVVSKKSVAPGDTVQPGTPLYTVVDPTRMRLVAHVPAEGIVGLQIGTPVEFVVAGAGSKPFTGTVQRINPVADPTTRQVEIHVALPNEGGRLVSGLYAEGRVATAVHEALAVPAAAIDRSLGTPALLRVAQGRVERVPVQLGIADENSEKVEVLSGVAQGDVVLLGAAKAITPGARVVVQNAAPPAAKPTRDSNGA
ncbi:MAG TPA: efflux RND transporter periplasmic adaptor subunit [Thermoanaerobaculia bacterium]|jgi:RND family efflux transporter MFP subunit|nr:efflux RND transporter periplasmic adaptor subunit [Thermoanaerobaculia bacterium]